MLDRLIERLEHPFVVAAHVLVWGVAAAILLLAVAYVLGYLHGRAAGKAFFLRSMLNRDEKPTTSGGRPWLRDVLVGAVVLAVVVGGILLLSTIAAPPTDDAPAARPVPPYPTHPWRPLRPRHDPAEESGTAGSGPGKAP